MDQERTYFIFFLVLFVLLFPCPLSSLQGKDDSASAGNLTFDSQSSSGKNVIFHDESSIMNESLHLSPCAAAIFSLQGPDANFSVSFSTEFSFSVQGSNTFVFFFSSEKLLLDEPVEAVKFKPLMIPKDLLEFRNGGLVTTGALYHGRNRYLTTRIHHSRNRFKNPVLSAKFNLGKQIRSFLYEGFSAPNKAGNDTILVIKSRIFEISSPSSSQFENYEKKDVVHGFCTPILAVMSIFSAIWSYLRKLFKKKEKTPEITPPEAPDSTHNSSISNLLAGFHRFTYRELSEATKHFHQSELLGQGRYASVYRSVFRRSINIYAVKRFNHGVLSKVSFEIEATTIHRLRHERILELRGWCDEKPDEPLLLFDYMHNRSLQEALRNRHQPLLWRLRYKIAVGVAEALVYLHEECLPRVIHSDIKEGNVMLDADFNPKLGDFGLAMSAPPYTLRRETTERDPPECQPCEEVTAKLDVYLYGSLLLGLCCKRTEQPKKFCRRLRDLKLEGRLLEAVDQSLNGRYNEEEMLKILNVALQCMEPRVHRRPSMVQVLQTLTEVEIEELGTIFHIEL